MQIIPIALISVDVLNIAYSQSTVCLTSPPELEWTTTTENHQGTLTFDSYEFDSADTGYPVDFTTRVHNGALPSPTLRFKRGETYELTLINNLPYENASNLTNQIHDLSISNIHTHGMHISGETPGDNIFDAINGGEQMTYIYQIPCDHAGGLFWWHPHHHGATAVQVGGGAAGAIIVEDDPEAEGYPLWLETMDELVLVIQHMDLRRVAQVGSDSSADGIVDNIFDYDNRAADAVGFWLINGQYEPDICLDTGVWMRFRIVNVDMREANEYTIDADGGDSSECEVYLIARDGVLIHGANNEVPRELKTRKMYFSTASRADVAVRCNTAGTYTISTNEDNGGNRTIANIVVTDNAFGAETNVELTTFNPLRPEYLHSLIDISAVQWIAEGGEYNQETIQVQRLTAAEDADQRVAINGELFGGQDSNIFNDSIKAGSLQEWEFRGASGHPFHVHINHFQVYEEGITGSDANWTHLGDWLDVLNEQGTVRFVVDRFGGKVILHCHILSHEDTGTMAITHIEGGCNALGDNIDSTGDACDDSKNCDDPFFIPPTRSPTSCGSRDDVCFEDTDCCTGICRREGTCL